ncbi:MFS transporter [Virgisporangium aliadipatigenens]|uniref:MFS transporter n=1 Tax=Virgisporangium aliadipatigenens TaxID=741659 RepID=A0A8J3YW04_9ACTN|nr:MFS transporter [Virgisporangium aliadipatigenens]GIJ50723.1 MFS transporter [Virgisporangium aliadipatigenens]
MLWSRNFVCFFVARAVSAFGDAMLVVAAALAIGEIYGATGVGIVLAAWMVPFLGCILFGGVLADRIGARPLMFGADLTRLLAQGTVAVAFFVGTPALWLLLGCSAVSGCAAAMFQPGVNSMVPLVAGDAQRANATIRVANSVAELLGPATAGVLFGFLGAGPVYAVDAATFAVSAVCLAGLRLDAKPVVDRSASPWRDLVEGWRAFRERTWIWSVILVWVVYGIMLFGPLIPLGAVLVSERLGAPAYGWMQSAVGAGTVLGGLAALRLKPAHPLAVGAAVMLGYALLPLAIALHAALVPLLAAAAVNGAAWAFWSIMWQTSVQTHVPPKLLNRVTAYEVLGSDGSLPVGQALCGPVAGAVGPERLLLGSVAVGVGGCVALLLTPAVRKLSLARPSPEEKSTSLTGAR